MEVFLKMAAIYSNVPCHSYLNSLIIYSTYRLPFLLMASSFDFLFEDLIISLS